MRSSRRGSRSRIPTPPDLGRNAILDLLRRADAPLAFETIAQRLGAGATGEREVLSVRLQSMTEEGQIVRNRKVQYGSVERMNLLRGRVIGHPDGYGFVVPEDGGKDLYLAPREMQRVIHGDRVLVRVREVDRRGRVQCALVEVLERNTDQIVGRFFRSEGGSEVGFVVSDNRRIQHELLIPAGAAGHASDGDIVVAALTEPPGTHSPPVGRIEEVLGDHMAPGMEIEVAIRSHGLAHRWSERAAEEALAVPLEIDPGCVSERLDLRIQPFVTIDGPDAKDFDDAVHAISTSTGWRLDVAIADVSHYVTPGSALDVEARRRGTSAYFPGRVLPMLPERLSNGICSLNPGVDRLVLICRMSIDRAGRVARSAFHRAVIRSRRRLTYSEVYDGIVRGVPALRRDLGSLVEPLETLRELYRALKRARRLRGALEIDSVEPRIVFGRGARARRIDRIETAERNTAHEIIEECMIAANVCAARFLERNRLPGLYRVHEPPSEERCAELRLYLSELGLSPPSLESLSSMSPAPFQAVLEAANGRPDARLVQTLVLRAMKQAEYRARNSGHFGLGLSAYAHFTSPIRRYPDLLVHRVISAEIRNRKHDAAGGADVRAALPYAPDEMPALGAHCSMTERRAEDAVRDALAWLKCEYMVDKVGETYSGSITAVTSFGIFVEIPEMMVEGLVHVSALGDDYYQYDPVRHRLQGERHGHVFRLADTLEVRVSNVDLDERKIDFEPAARGERGSRGIGRRSFGGRRRSRSAGGARRR